MGQPPLFNLLNPVCVKHQTEGHVLSIEPVHDRTYTHTHTPLGPIIKPASVDRQYDQVTQ